MPSWQPITLDDYLDRSSRSRPRGHDPCLVFDQFEELFTLDPTDSRPKAAFLTELGVALRDRGRWALFAMREDFIAQLDPYLALVPEALRDPLPPRPARARTRRRRDPAPAADAGVDFTPKPPRGWSTTSAACGCSGRA